MKAVILGAGITGVTTAYMLAKRGFEVTIIDQHDQPAKETSFANGGQLSYRYKTPIANPAVFKQLPKISLGLDPAFKIHPTIDSHFYAWALHFLWQCKTSNSKQSSISMRKLGAIAQQQLYEIIKDSGINFDFRKSSGKLYVYRHHKTFQQTIDNLIKNHESEIWDQQTLYEKVPAFRENPTVIGAIYDTNEDAADCHKFCVELLEYITRNYPVRFLNNHTILEIKASQNKHRHPSITGIKTNKGLIQGDAYILTAGVHSTTLSKPLALKLPIYPIKGYSVTVPATTNCSNISVTDTDKKTVYCRLGERLRIAGFAEFSGMKTDINTKRIHALLENARQFMPDAGEYQTIQDSWCGLRPSTPDSLPIVGETGYHNLFMNTGHGMLGWTHSAATALMTANCLTQSAQPMNIEAFSISRFR